MVSLATGTLKKKKKQGKHLLPTSFPGAPHTADCPALNLQDKSVLSIGVAIDGQTPLPATCSILPLMKTLQL